MSNKYEVSAYVITEGLTEDDAQAEVHTAMEGLLRHHDGILEFGITGVCPFYDEDAPYCEECEE
jgi:hypothetical protein